MSQSHNPTDSQGLLQSMLQRLKLQSGREGQPYVHTSVPNAASSTWNQDGEKGATSLQKVNNNPVNGFDFGANGTPTKGFGISATDSKFGLKHGEVQQPGHGYGTDRGQVSFPSRKDRTDNDMGENRVLGQATSPGITAARTEQLFPSKSLKDTDITSFKRTAGERVSFGSSSTARHNPGDKDAATSLEQNQDQDFKPRVYVWSLKPNEANLDPGSQENKVQHVGNGGFGALAQSKDMQFVASSQKTTNNTSRRKQRSSENKTRRWTQKIKEKLLDRSGSFSKKGKEVDQTSEPGTENQLLTTGSYINTSNKEGERTLSNPSQTPSTHTEDNVLDGAIRSSSDFDFGLGSFSLLDEIVTGQEWAKFLNPNLQATAANQRPSEESPSELKISQSPYDSGQSSVILNQQGGGNNPWSFQSISSSPGSDFSMAQISPVSMDVTEGKQPQYVHRGADQSEPMEDGHNQSYMQSAERGRGQTQRPPSIAEPANVLDRRVHLNRKRHHQSSEKTSDGNEAGRGGSVSPPSHAMESQHDDVIPLYTLNSPTCLSSSPNNPGAPAPRGVLRHSLSQDSELSMETVTKRRRVEENRRVRFAEKVQTIAPPEVDLDATESEEDLGSEEDSSSVIEQEIEAEQPAIEVVAPVRRHALPAWIKALKRKNSGKKHR